MLYSCDALCISMDRQVEPPKSLSVAALRRAGGVDFESEAAVLRGPPPQKFWKKFLPFLSIERNTVAYGEVRKTQPHLFITQTDFVSNVNVSMYHRLSDSS